MLQEVFAEVVEVAERAAEDVTALSEIAASGETTRQETTYEANIGGIFKKSFRISPEGGEWKGRRLELDSITRTRWGGIRQSMNGIPMGTTYTVVLGTTSDVLSVELRSEDVFTNIVDRVWRTAGVRLLTEYLKGLRDGRQYAFGSVVVSDTGMELERKKHLLSRSERVFYRWDEFVNVSLAGAFCFVRISDKGILAALPYLEVDNVHVLEAALRALKKERANRLSSLLGEHQ
jgi:hypothetical protein